MLKQSCAIFALSSSLLAGAGFAQTEAVAPAPEAAIAHETGDAATEKILVVGQRPGPGLWKISKDDHVLWIFGTYGPLPKKLEWRSQQVETILAQSQEYLEAPGASPDVGVFRQMTLLPFVIGIKKNPDGATLQTLLPPAVYARWLPLKKKYIGENDDIERERPFFAASELFQKGIDRAGLTSSLEVRKSIEKLVKKSKIKTTATVIKLELNDPVAMIRDFKKSSMEDIACFSKTLDRLESDLDAMRVRANAWAKGDLEVIQKLSYEDREGACGGVMTNSAAFNKRSGFQDVEARMLAAWLQKAEAALAANASTFAMLPMKFILDPKGYLAALEAKGYKVEKPE